MAHFALVQNGLVTDVVVADQDFINTGALGDPANWVQTSYNTYGGVHYVPNSDPRVPSEDQSKAINKNYAGIGYSWDGIGFAAPQPYPSWTLNPDTYLWEAPVPYPQDGKVYTWDEATQSWVEVPQG